MDLNTGVQYAVAHSRRTTKTLECLNGTCNDVAVPCL